MSTPLRERPDAPLGTLIFRAGLLPAETIESALEEGVKTGKRLGEILTERGLISEVDLARLLAGQKGLDFVTLREQIVDPTAAALFTEEQARLFRALPYSFDGELPVVAIADPTDEVLMRNVREALGRDDARFVVSARGELAEIAADVYSRPLAQPEAAPPVPEEDPVPHVEHLNGHAPHDAELVVQAPAYEPEQAPEPEPEPGPEPAAFALESEPRPEPEPAVVHAPVAEELQQAPEPVAAAAPEPVQEPVSEPVLHVEPELEPAPAPEPVAPEPYLPPAAAEPPAPLEPPALPEPLPLVAETPLPAAPPPPAEPTVAAEPLRVAEPEAPPEPAFVAEPPAVYEQPAYEPAAYEPPASEPVPLPQPPAPEPAPHPPAAAQPEPLTQVPEPPVAAPAPWRLTIRLTNGERVEAGDFPDQAAAKLEARTIMTQVADADSDEWPFVNGRFLKPDTIVSVDIAELTGDES